MQTRRRVPKVAYPCGQESCRLCYRWALGPSTPDDAAAEARDITTWRTSDGRVLKVTEMTDGHVMNTVNWLKRNGGSPRSYMLPVLERELQRREARRRVAGEPAPREYVGEWLPYHATEGNVSVTLTPVSDPSKEGVTITRKGVPVDDVMPAARGIPVDDILPTIRENLVQHEQKVQRG